MTFNVYLAQFDIAPTRKLIISRCKIAKYVTSHVRNVTTFDKGGGRSQNNMKFV